MSTSIDPYLIAWWTENFDELDREIGRLSSICRVKILEPGVIERVLRKDGSVCGTENPAAFAKLHDLLMLYFGIRKKAVLAVGQLLTARIETHVVDQLRSRFSDVLGKDRLA